MIRSRPAVTGSCFGSMFFLGVGITIVGAAARNIGLRPEQVGLLVTVQNLGFMVSVAFAGALADRLSKPAILSVGSALLAGSFALLYATPIFWVNLLVMFATGIGIGAYEGASDALLLDIHRRANLVVTVNHLFVSLGSLSITLYLIFLQMAWRSSVTQIAAVIAVLAVVFALTRASSFRPAAAPPSLRMLLRERAIGLLFLLEVAAIGLGGGISAVLTSFLMELRGFDQVTSKIGLIVFLGGMASGRVFSGFVAKHDDIRRSLPLLFACAAAATGALFFIRTPPALTYVLIAVSGLSVAPMLPSIIAFTGMLYRDAAGTAMGLIKLALPVGGIVVPFTLSVLARWAGFGVSLIVFPTAAAAGLLLTVAGRKLLGSAPDVSPGR